MRKRISRVVWLTVAWTALSVVRLSLAEGAKDTTVSAPPPKGVLSADKKQVVVGETVHLLLDISGGEGLRAGVFEQPALPMLAHLALLTVGQRNELAFRSGGRVFSTTFLYTLKARSPGAEKIPAIQVKYRGVGDGESHTISVEGLEITIGEGRRVERRTVALVILVIAGGALLGAAWRMRARRRKGGDVESKMPECEGPGSAEREKSRGAVEALAMLEDAHGLKTAGEWGEYGARITAALSAYLERDSSAEIEKLKGGADALCERVRYAKDRDAERGIEECARKAEIFFKNKIRESIATTP